MSDQAAVISQSGLAEYFDVSLRTIQNWMREGKLPPPLDLPGSVVRWRKTDIDAWLDRRSFEE